MKNVTVTLVDDLDQSEASESISFDLDGHEYEIDLNQVHADELRTMVGKYISVARRVRASATGRRPRRRTQADREQARRIRTWAVERGLMSSARGRLPAHVVSEYEATMRVGSAPFRSPGASEPEPAHDGGAARRRPAPRRRPEAGPGPAQESRAPEGMSDLTERERRVLTAIAEYGKPGPGAATTARGLRSGGLVDRDSQGNWWITEAGKHLMASA
jgi:hypothetical protein